MSSAILPLIAMRICSGWSVPRGRQADPYLKHFCGALLPAWNALILSPVPCSLCLECFPPSPRDWLCLIIQGSAGACFHKIVFQKLFQTSLTATFSLKCLTVLFPCVVLFTLLTTNWNYLITLFTHCLCSSTAPWRASWRVHSGLLNLLIEWMNIAVKFSPFIAT